jgi:putative DNA primase/helicase
VIALSLRSIARALGGEITGAQVLAPGPGHGPKDRSLSIRISPTAPDGFVAFSHSGDPWDACKDHVRSRLGIDRRPRENRPQTTALRRPPSSSAGSFDTADDRTGPALALWHAGVDPRGTLAERYLSSRSLELAADVAGDVLRWHPGVKALLALFRNISTGEPQAVSRTFLDAQGRKIERKFFGPVGAAAVMLDPFDAVTHGLHICEGIETGLAARQLGLKPTWALGSAGAIAAFPVLDGVECLTLLAENDAASARSVEACASRWHAAGREVLINEPTVGKDLNDSVRGAA